MASDMGEAEKGMGGGRKGDAEILFCKATGKCMHPFL